MRRWIDFERAPGRGGAILRRMNATDPFAFGALRQSRFLVITNQQSATFFGIGGDSAILQGQQSFVGDPKH
jgi:hypothetical protein